MRILIALFAIVGILLVAGCDCGSNEPEKPNEVSQLIDDIDNDFQRLDADIKRLQADLDNTAGTRVPIDAAYKPNAGTFNTNAEPRLESTYGCIGSNQLGSDWLIA